jgi:hypothetical protein
MIVLTLGRYQAVELPVDLNYTIAKNVEKLRMTVRVVLFGCILIFPLKVMTSYWWTNFRPTTARLVKRSLLVSMTPERNLSFEAERIEIYRGTGFLAVILFGSSPIPFPLSRQEVASLSQPSCVSPVQLTDEGAESYRTTAIKLGRL